MTAQPPGAGSVDVTSLILQSLDQMRTDTAGHFSQLRSDLAARDAALNARLDKFVTSDVHASDLRRVDDHLTTLAAGVGVEQAQRAEADAHQAALVENLRLTIESESASRREGDEKTLARVAEQDRQRRRNNQAILGLLVALLGVLVTLAVGLLT